MNMKKTAHYLANRHPEKLVILSICEHEGRKQKHHPDYSKPYEVELLCCKCHGEKRRGNYCLLKKDIESGASLIDLAKRIGVPATMLRAVLQTPRGAGTARLYKRIDEYYGM